MISKIVCGDCLKVLPDLPDAKMVFADPPDNVRAEYNDYADNVPNWKYALWLGDILNTGIDSSSIFWLSYAAKHHRTVWHHVGFISDYPFHFRQYIWRFTFGQHNEAHCGSGYRPLLCIDAVGSIFYPDAIRVPSARQTKYNDKRANPKGRVPDDVWEFPRVCGTFKERKKWHPCQHPKDLLRRIVLYSTQPGDLVIDMFAGSGNMLEVCKELDRPCIGVDISEFYCRKIAEETGAEFINGKQQ